MDFALSHEQRMLVDTVRAFIAAELKPLEQEVEATGALAPGRRARCSRSRAPSASTP